MCMMQAAAISLRMPGVTVSSMLMHPAFPHEIVIGLNQRDPRYFDAYQFASGQR